MQTIIMGLGRGYLGIMEKNMKTIMMGLHRVQGLGFRGLGFRV